MDVCILLYINAKMPLRCAAVLCNNVETSTKSTSFFKFPKKEDLFNIWASNCGRVDLEFGRNVKRRVICDKHFNETDFSLFTNIRKRLRPAAVPRKLIIKTSSRPRSVSPTGSRIGITELTPLESELRIGVIGISYYPEENTVIEIGSSDSEHPPVIISHIQGEVVVNRKPKFDESPYQNSVLNSTLGNSHERECVKSVLRTTLVSSEEPFYNSSSMGKVIDDGPSLGPKINHCTNLTSGPTNVGRNGVKYPLGVLNKEKTEVGPKTNACGVESEVCPHYIAFIEEKAKSHGLRREVERLKEELEVVKEESKREMEILKDDVRTLNQVIIQRNASSDNDIVIKEEKIELNPCDVFS